METVKLTQFSHGAGCGCKISPQILDKMLASDHHFPKDAHILVGNDTRDDAAVYDLGNGTALISTTDFFMPIVDDAFDFGSIAAANAISDVYAMGGKPILAIAILGWPINKIAPEIAQKVLEGARKICAEAGIRLAGGHSIDSPEPIFGLAVNGILPIQNLKKNCTATENCTLYLSKQLGVGILSTAQKKGLLTDEHSQIAPQSMMKLNKIGEKLGSLSYIKALTDVTGFGLLGHLIEMCEGSEVSAELNFNSFELLPFVQHYLDLGCIPGGTTRNFQSYGHKVNTITETQKNILCDPQTSGGLLVAVDNQNVSDFENFMISENFNLKPIGKTQAKKEKYIYVV